MCNGKGCSFGHSSHPVLNQEGSNDATSDLFIGEVLEGHPEDAFEFQGMLDSIMSNVRKDINYLVGEKK